MRFRWNAWNLEHATKHGCTVSEIETVAGDPARGYPRRIGDGKYLVNGRGQGGRMVEVIYILDPDFAAFVIHAMPVTKRRRRSR